MRIFLDANILVSVLNKEYPLFTYTSRILSLNDTKHFELLTSPICLAIAFYFSEKKFNFKIAKNKIRLLTTHLTVVEVSATTVEKVLENPSINDFEDGLEYYAAEKANCNCIITEDINDYYYSRMEVLKSQEFFLKYMAKRKD